MAWKNRGGAELNSRNLVSRKMTVILCICCFFAGLLFTDRMWTEPEAKGISKPTGIEVEKLKLLTNDCDTTSDARRDPKDIIGEVSNTRNVIQTLDKTISNLEMELAAARAMQDSIVSGTPISDDLRLPEPIKK